MLKCASLVLALCSVGLAEQIDNPEYQLWAKFTVGAYVKMKSTMDMGEMKTEAETTTTLKSLTAEKAVIAMSGVQVVSGQRVEMPETTRDVPAKIDKPELPPQDPKAEAPKVETKQGEEKVDIAGAKVKCNWVETSFEMSGQKTVSKAWTSNEVPGSIVKQETNSQGMAQKSWVTEFKK